MLKKNYISEKKGRKGKRAFAEKKKGNRRRSFPWFPKKREGGGKI